MKKAAFVMLGGMILSFYLVSCTKQKGIPVQPGAMNQVDSTKLQNVTYSGSIRPILVMYCYGESGQSCHVTNTNIGANGDFTTYDGLKDKVDNGSIDSRVFQRLGSPMPPTYANGPKELTPTDLAVFKKWVEIGAPNN
jgi:hypothetical protein